MLKCLISSRQKVATLSLESNKTAVSSVYFESSNENSSPLALCLRPGSTKSFEISSPRYRDSRNKESEKLWSKNIPCLTPIRNIRVCVTSSTGNLILMFWWTAFRSETSFSGSPKCSSIDHNRQRGLSKALTKSRNKTSLYFTSRNKSLFTMFSPLLSPSFTENTPSPRAKAIL